MTDDLERIVERLRLATTRLNDDASELAIAFGELFNVPRKSKDNHPDVMMIKRRLLRVIRHLEIGLDRLPGGCLL